MEVPMHVPRIAPVFSALALVTLQASTSAQSYVFQIQQSASNFNWSGTTSLGPIVGNPSTAFQLAGTTGLDLTVQIGSQPIAGGDFSGGDAFTVPDIHGKIPNLLPFLPPLATIDLVGLHVSASSDPFTVDGTGAFSGTGTLTALAGTLTVTVLGQSPSTTPLAGNASDPGPVSGTFTTTAGNIHLSQPVNSTFSFSDPTSGASGSITIVGTIESNYAVYTSFCSGDGSTTACPCGNASVGAGRGCNNSSSTGGAQLAAEGLAALGADSLYLTSSFEKPNATSIFLQGRTQLGSGVAFGQGLRCIGGTLKRLFAHNASLGVVSAPTGADLSVSAQSTVLGDPISPGEMRFYQVYYRDPNVLGTCAPDATFNASQALSVAWHP
jgi:hypothetical protein